MAKKGGSWHLNYQIKQGVGTPDDKFEANVHRTKKGLHIVINAGIPELDDDMMNELESHIDAVVQEFDDANASDSAEHQKCLRAIAGYCTWLADAIQE